MNSPSAQEHILRIVRALRVLLVPATPGEYDLHALVACALTKADLPFCHEAKLAPGCRVDFVSGGIAIEVKKGKPVKGALIKQVNRYLSIDGIDGIVVVSAKSTNIPSSILGKPVYCLSLDKLWGVALP